MMKIRLLTGIVFVLLISTIPHRALSQCTLNYLQNPGFEAPVAPGLGNNFYDQNIPAQQIPNWSVQGNLTANIIKTDGVTNYNGGPNAASEGTQYFDALSGNTFFFVSQTFVLGCTADLTFRGDFSARDGGDNWDAYIEIVNSSNVVVATSATRSFIPTDLDLPGQDAVWYTLAGTATGLPAGTYTYRARLWDDGNFDNAFLCASPGCLLPVTLKAFDVKLNGCVSSAKWSATEETNLSNYTLEYSKNGIDFTPVSVLDASGINKEYTVQHIPAAGRAFYRLKMVDIDGKTAYSKLQVLNISCTKNTVLVFPNPVTDQLNVNVNFVNGSHTASAALYDISGRVILRKQLVNGTNAFDTRALTAGIYNLVLVQDGEVTSYKIKK
ncbi:MAG: T9SS type A sorting domain-containing protein [Chitinophagales bacterium]|nr:T9SS type A sorting domain-containing protein [Chitinophagales bacterium]